jgi:hypothetical protein
MLDPDPDRERILTPSGRGILRTGLESFRSLSETVQRFALAGKSAANPSGEAPESLSDGFRFALLANAC